MIILASTSPRRKEILKEILKDQEFKIVPSNFDERKIVEPDCKKLCLIEAIGKGMCVSKEYPNDFIISSDTMVYYQGREIGKPKDEEDAFRTLKMLQNNTHSIITAYSIIKDSKILKDNIVEAILYIDKMSDDEIKNYIETGSPLDKAGSYGLQDKDYIKGKIIKGSMYTIIGLPKDELEKDLKDLKLI